MLKESPLLATPKALEYCNTLSCCKSCQFPLDDFHTITEPSSLELANTPGASHVIICTPSDDGLLTAAVINGPSVCDSLKVKMLIEPSHLPTAKCWRSIHAAS